MNTSYWNGKAALVSGGSSGLGRAIAVELARQGARVAIAARGQEQLDAAAAELRALSGETLAVRADASRQTDVDRLVGEVVARFGRLDLLVNAVGRSARGTAISATPEEFAELIEINLLTTVRMTRAAAPHLLSSRGHLVNVGSLASKISGRYMGAYAASKFALAAYSEQLRVELGPEGLSVLLVCPGPIARDEPRHYAASDPALPASAQRPGGGVRLRGLQPGDVARRVLHAAEHKRAELVLPGRARLLFAAAAISPRLGDWLVRRLTSRRGETYRGLSQICDGFEQIGTVPLPRPFCPQALKPTPEVNGESIMPAAPQMRR